MAASWSGQVFILPQGDGTARVGLALPSGKHAAGSFRVLDGTGPVPPTGFPDFEDVDDADAWLKRKEAEGFKFSEATEISEGEQLTMTANTESIKKTRDIESDWTVLIPMTQLDVSNDAPINGQWEVGDTLFMSREAAEAELSPPKLQAEVPDEHRNHILGDYKAFAKLRRQGKPGELLKSVFREVREAKNILAATDAPYGARHLNSGFNLQGYPIITARSAWFVDQDGKNLFGNSSREGALQPWRLDQNWHKNVTQTGIAELFAAIIDPALDDAWRRQIRRAAACIGRSLASLERADAFLLNVFALETLLTRRGERNGEKLGQRIKGMTGWHLKKHRPNYQAEIYDIFGVRCDAVHDADYGQLTPENLLLSDLYAKNTLLNIVLNRGKFPTKDDMATVLDDWAANENWPQDDSFTLRWIGNTTFDPKALNLHLW